MWYFCLVLYKNKYYIQSFIYFSTLLPFYFFTFSTPSSLITPLSFGEVAGGEALSLLEKADKTVAIRSTEYR